MSSSIKSVNNEDYPPKDTLSKIMEELSNLRTWQENQDKERNYGIDIEAIREEERRKIMSEIKRERKERGSIPSSASSSHKSHHEEGDYYGGSHRSNRYGSHRRESRRHEPRVQEPNVTLPHFHGKDNVEAYLD